MTIPNVNPYTGQKPSPEQPQPEFNQNMSDELDFLNALPEQLNPAIDAMNTTATQVTNDAASAAQSASDAFAAAGNNNYKGEWVSGTSSASEAGETWQVNGAYYVSLKATSVEPVNDNVNWRGVNDYGTVNEGLQVTRRRGTSAEIAAFTPADGEFIYNTDDGSIHAGDGITPGGIKHLNIKMLDIVYKGDGTQSAVDKMINGDIAEAKIGDTCRTGAMNWVRVGATIPPEASDFKDKTANIFDFGDAKISTVNKMIQAGIKRIIMPISMEADETLIPAQGVFLDTGNAWCTITNNIPNGAPFIKWNSTTDGGILRWFRWGNFLINNGAATGPIFNLFGIQHCKFGDFWAINSKGGSISFAYFNTFDKVQLQNLKERLVFTGLSQSTDCNFNYIGRVTINNWAKEGLVIENSRGNSIVQFDAETSLPMIGPALHLQDSSYNKVEHFWSEVLDTAEAPTILIDSVISQSNNKKNIIEHVPQIITPGTGIKVMDSVDTKIGEARLVGCSVGIDDAGGNSGMVIYEPQFDACTEEMNLLSNDTIVQRKPNKIEGKVNVNYTINSIEGGFGGYEYRVDGNLRWKVTCKSTYDVDVTTGRGLAAQWIDNPSADRSQYSLRSGLHFGVSVTGADVQPNSLFRDSTDQKLKYKDSSSVIHLLY